MLEWITLGLFSLGLLICLITGRSILIALVFGFFLFMGYGRRQGYGLKALLSMALEGVRTVKNILITFLLIGILTAFWRAAGTIPMIVSTAARWIRPEIFLLMTFLLNCGVSMLTGTSFGTGATMGVICASIGVSLHMDLRLVGGAILSGIFFGDRCSPVSTSALLVSTLTKTDIYDNIRRMLRTALIPFGLSCILYTVLGFYAVHAGAASKTLAAGTANANAVAGSISAVPDMAALFGEEFILHPVLFLPAAVILVLSLARVRVKAAMTISILTSIPLCLFVQHIPAATLLQTAFGGFHAADPAVAPLIDGGGIISMIRVACVVSLSSSYSGVFQHTPLLSRPREAIAGLSMKTNAYIATLVTSVLAGMLACNQSLTVMLTHQLCGDLYPDAASRFAIDLEDSAIVTAPLVPWSIAGAVPLAAAGAPMTAILFAVYLILLPLWRLLSSLRAGHHMEPGHHSSLQTCTARK